MLLQPKTDFVCWGSLWPWPGGGPAVCVPSLYRHIPMACGNNSTTILSGLVGLFTSSDRHICRWMMNEWWMMAVPESIKSDFCFLIFAPPYLAHLVFVLDLTSLLPLAFLPWTSAPDKNIYLNLSFASGRELFCNRFGCQSCVLYCTAY